MADHCVRSGLTYNGDGTTWAAASGDGLTGAYNEIPASLTRGDTYYVADGAYGAYTFNDAVSGSLYIYIKKAISTDHGTETGWLSSYGDGVALFENAGTVFLITTNYWEIDGQVGSGTSGHGIKIKVTDNTLGDIRNISITSGPSYITVKHVEMEGAGEDIGLLEGAGPYSRHDGFYANISITNILLSYVYIHDLCRCGIIFSGVSNSTVEYSVLGKNHNDGSGAIPHIQTIQGGPGVTDNIIIRHNVIFDTMGTGMIVALDATHTNWEIYGNIFYHTSARYYNSPETIGNTSGDTATGMKVYNNTFATLNNSCGIRWEGGSGNVAYNNLFYNVPNILWTGVTHDYNWFYDAGSQSETHIQNGSGDPFVNLSGYDFHLIGATDNGKDDLGSPYNVDMDGVVRGADGVWDRGGYEYEEGLNFAQSSVLRFG